VRSSHDLSRVSASFDERHVVPGAGLLPAALLVQRIGLASLIDRRLHLPVEAANSGVKACTVLGSMLAGGDSIDDVALLRAAAGRITWNCSPVPRVRGREEYEVF